MIIPKSIEAFYGKRQDHIRILQYNVDQILGNIAESLQVIYKGSRIKPKDSFMAKIEKEGCKNPSEQIEDFLACRLIINSNSNIKNIIQKLEEIFNIESQNIRNYKPNEFTYDDIQLILSFKDSPFISKKEILGKKFELQIRTGLQDALAEVVRGETYKTDVLTWQKERTASELKASLELIDNILSDFATVSSVQEEKDYKLFQERNEIIRLLQKYWTVDKLPSDLRRASIIIRDYLRLADITVEELSRLLSLTNRKDIIESTSITPCQIILVILFLEKPRFYDKVKSENKCLLITEEMIDICPELNKIERLYRVNLD